MTTLYTIVYPHPEGKKFFSFDTDDDFPHIGDVTSHHLGHPFHVLRGGEKSEYTRDAMMIILRFALSQFEFKYKTVAPQIVDNEFELLELDGINAALIEYEDFLIVSTVVMPTYWRRNKQQEPGQTRLSPKESVMRTPANRLAPPQIVVNLFLPQPISQLAEREN